MSIEEQFSEWPKSEEYPIQWDAYAQIYGDEYGLPEGAEEEMYLLVKVGRLRESLWVIRPGQHILVTLRYHIDQLAAGGNRHDLGQRANALMDNMQDSGYLRGCDSALLSLMRGKEMVITRLTNSAVYAAAYDSHCK